MARARAAEQQRSRSKTALIEEITLGIAKFQEVVAAINDIGQEGFPYRDAAQSKAELQFRECLRHTFGERSQEFQTHRNFKIRTAEKADVTRCLAVIKGLIHTLEDRKLELQGLKPPPQTEPSPEAILGNTARMMPVSTAAPTATIQTASPMTFAMAVLNSVGPSNAPVTQIPQTQPAAPSPSIPPPASNPAPIQTPPLTPMPAPAPTPTAMPTASTTSTSPVVAPTPSPPPTPAPTPVVQPTRSASDTVEATPAQPETVPVPVVSAMAAQPNVNAPASAVPSPSTRAEASRSIASMPQDSSTDRFLTGSSSTRSMEPALDQDPLQLVRKVCLRLHAVARQLRLRRDYRPTLEIEDDYDLQDLLGALLKVEFDEVATEEWTPPY
ncbi:MAG: hypothetical protein KF693_19175, partial [Nitrospira sp.]|nr:hypothetical protein [Nitrospira sp.]